MKKHITKEKAVQKLRHYCTYQERSHFEVRQKLWELGLYQREHDLVISGLIEDGYLNEERYSKAFAGGKFRMKDWGRKKIYKALKEKQISEYNIVRAIKEIDEETYQQKLQELAEKKYLSLQLEGHLMRKKKTMDYLLQKGYEADLILRFLNECKDR